MTGVDPLQANIAAASEHASLDPEIQGRLHYYCGSVEEFARGSGGGAGGEEGGGGGEERGFDAVVASEVVEHVVNLPTFINELCSLVKV